jgi:hypothetical protein
MNIFTFFENFKEKFKFWAIGCMSRALSLSPSAPKARSELGGGGPSIFGFFSPGI